MPEYLSPGVYVEEVERGARPIEGVSTSTVGFLGPTERGPTDPELVTSFADFERRFGGFALYRRGERLASSYLGYAVEGFFRNGGTRCYVGRITPENAETAGAMLADGSEVMSVTAVGPGIWGRNASVTVEDAALYQEDRNELFKVTVRYWTIDADAEAAQAHDADTDHDDVPAPDVEEVYDNLSPRETSSDYYETRINDTSDLIEVERVGSGRPATDETVWLALGNSDSNDGENGGNSPGDDDDSEVTGELPDDYETLRRMAMAYGGDEVNGSSSKDAIEAFFDDFSEEEIVELKRLAREEDPNPTGDGGQPSLTLIDYRGDSDAPPGERNGLAAFEAIDDISIACIPDENSIEGLTAELVTHCENVEDRFAIVQAEQNAGDVSDLEPRIGSARLDSSYAAFYYPWIKVMDPETNDPKLVPPGGHVAGIYARNDTERGVHKAPANEVVRGARELEVNLTKREQDVLNPKGVNCIRSLRGRGIRVWGARTTSSDPLWKYLNVRRLFLFLEESIDEATQWVVFEPNNERLWARVRQTVSNFLTTQWENGMLMGTTREEAFFVRCDRSTMTQDDIDNGRLIVEIGVAPVKPAEFVVFRIAQWTGGAEEA